MEFIKRLESRSPVYLEQYRSSIIDRFSNVGKTGDEGVYKAGKTFHRVYEVYMYALIVGLRKDYKLPLPAGGKTVPFIEIKIWQPREVVEFIIASLIARSDIDFNAIEDMDEKEVEEEITKLKKLMEEYAHGGFELLERAINEDSYRFDNDDKAFIDFLDEL